MILYETEEGLVRLQEVLRLQNTFRADAIKVAKKDKHRNVQLLNFSRSVYL